MNNPDWSALFLHQDGERQPAADLCPNTIAALSGAPLTDIPGRAPSILFSRLAAGAHIPPHTGVLNSRLICHLALVVPDGCELRVGNETRVWQEGKAWVFDDSIEHEARNAGDRDRYILLFDIWRPELSGEERSAIGALCSAIDGYCGKTAWDA
ncbi:MAG: aspartyl/asparaginyl beta-hydroxylase domain-containing protein [Lysobacter sp.]|nr:aspartyl/asparaginyl beta-hydroxylase domain-containing protein [Lysobacter sp.]